MKTRYNPFDPTAVGPASTPAQTVSAPKKHSHRARPKRPRRDPTPSNEEALARALNERSLVNYPKIISDFIARGIPADDIKPRENVFTFKAWQAQGRTVKKGEHGVKIYTRITIGGKDKVDPATGETTAGEARTRPGSATVFHISQTIPLERATEKVPVQFPKPAAPQPIPIIPSEGSSVTLAPAPSPQTPQSPGQASPLSWLDRLKNRKAA